MGPASVHEPTSFTVRLLTYLINHTMEKIPTATETEETATRPLNRRSFPHVLDLSLPSIDWRLSSPWMPERLSAIGADELSVFAPLEATHISALDAVNPSQRISWRQSGVSLGEFSTRSQDAPVRTLSARTAKDQSTRPVSDLSSTLADLPSQDAAGGNVSPHYDSSHGREDRSSWPPDSESLEEKPEYPTGFRLLSMVIALVLSIFLIALDMASS